jgi:RNA polymerase sigma-70 factor (ECF subfamily)
MMNLLNNPTDEKLVARTLTGDRNAFRVLVERHYTSVFRLCRSILRQPEDAEDATQEVFVRVHQNLSQFAGRGAFGAWLRRLTVNHCLNRTQTAAAKASSRSCSLELLAETLPASVDSDPEESLLRAENRVRIKRELDLLPPSQRAALGLRLIEGLSYEEIADLMGVPVNSVRSWLHRGRARLREALEEVVKC